MPEERHGISIEHEVYLGAIDNGTIYTINSVEATSVLGTRGDPHQDGSFRDGIELTQGAGSSKWKNVTVDEAVEDLQKMEQDILDRANERRINSPRLKTYRNRYGEMVEEEIAD